MSRRRPRPLAPSADWRPPAGTAPTPSRSEAGRPYCRAPSGQGGTAGPWPGLVRAAGPTASARSPSHLCLAPSGRGGLTRSPARAGEGGGSPPEARARGPSRPHCGAPPGQGGTADPRPGLVRAAGPTASARSPSHLWLAPSGREDKVAPRPGPVRAAGCRRRPERGTRVARIAGHRPGRVALPVPGPG